MLPGQQYQDSDNTVCPLYPERGGGLVVPAITASSQATGGTLGQGVVGG
jgi:hypothetical protein